MAPDPLRPRPPDPAAALSAAPRGLASRYDVPVLARLKVSPTGQVYQIDLPQLKVTRDELGGYYFVHGRGLFMRFEDREEAFSKQRELEVQGRWLGGQ